MKPTRILVTGATGFIGSRLCELLSLEYRLPYRALVRNFSRATRIARLDTDLVAGDVNGVEDVYLRDLQNSTTVRVGTGTGEGTGEGGNTMISSTPLTNVGTASIMLASPSSPLRPAPALTAIAIPSTRPMHTASSEAASVSTKVACRPWPIRLASGAPVTSE